MKYVVIETAERTSYVIGKASDMHEAREMMKERFRKIFWEKFPNEAESKQSLEEVYETNLDESEFEFDEETAFINGVHGYDYDRKILDTSCEDVLEKPLSIMEMLDCCDADLYVEGDVVIDLSELIDHDLEGILDIMAERLTGSSLLMDVNYSLVDILDENSAIMRVRGDITDILETDMDEAAFHAVADKLRTYLADDGNGVDDLKEFEDALDTMSEAALSERYVAARIRHEEKQETVAEHEPSYLEGAEQADSKRYALLAWNDEYLDLYMVPFVPQNMTMEEAKEALAKRTKERLVELDIAKDDTDAAALFAKQAEAEYDDECDELHVGEYEATIRYGGGFEERIKIVEQPQ